MYPIRLSAFEGPLDLLLYLIERQELEIAAVSLAEVTQQYLEALHSTQDLSVSALAEFILVAAKLCYIKSVNLLPRSPSTPQQEEGAGEDLVGMLLEYKRFKEAAGQLRAWEERGWRSYPRLDPFIPEPAGLPEGLKLEDLSRALEVALSRHKPAPQGRIESLAVRLEDLMAKLEQLLADNNRLSFSSVIEGCSTRTEVVVSFLALLELLRQGRVQVIQGRLFEDIIVTPR